MKIEQTQANRIAQTQTENTSAVEKSQRQQDKNLEALKSRDQASLSDRARMLVKARAAFDKTPEVRADRLAELRDRISSGKYEPPMEKLAQKLLDRVKA